MKIQRPKVTGEERDKNDNSISDSNTKGAKEGGRHKEEGEKRI